MEAPELVRRAMQAQSADGPTALARKLPGLDPHNLAKRIRRWLDGQNEPDYEATIALLNAAGLLREEARPPTPTARSAAGTAGATQFAELARAVETLIASVDALAREVRAGVRPTDSQLRTGGRLSQRPG